MAMVMLSACKAPTATQGSAGTDGAYSPARPVAVLSAPREPAPPTSSAKCLVGCPRGSDGEHGRCTPVNAGSSATASAAGGATAGDRANYALIRACVSRQSIATTRSSTCSAGAARALLT